MKRKKRVYLDTSVISALFDEKNPERKLLTQAFFKEIKNFEPFISEITIAEAERTPDPKIRKKIKDVIQLFPVFYLTGEVEWLANQYIRYGAVPENYPEDSYHIAVAVINEVDYLLSWNFRHIVRAKTKDIVRMVNTLNNFKQIEIMTPAELL